MATGYGPSNSNANASTNGKTATTVKGLIPTTGQTATTKAATTARATTTQQNGFALVNQLRAPGYTTVIGKSVPAVVHTAAPLHADILTVIQNVPALQVAYMGNGAGINVAIEGDVVVLRGVVLDQDQRSLAENVVRLSPGVHNVRNELQVAHIVPQQ